MTQLDCSVTNCKYNDKHCCCKENIMVDGKTARKTNETCCDSFVERTSNAVSNCALEPSRMTNVECKATNCQYNDDCNCHAGHIDIQGHQACCCGETKCATFCCC